MKANKTKVIELMIACGFPEKAVHKWSNNRFQDKLKSLRGNKAVEDAHLSDDQKTLLNEILVAVDANEEITLSDKAESKSDKKPAGKKDKKGTGKKTKAAKEEEADEADDEEADEEEEEQEEEEEKPAKGSSKKTAAKKTEAKPAKKKSSKKKAAAKEGVERDAFGNRVGTQSAKINALLSKKSMPVADIAKKTKLSEARVRAHLTSLFGKDLVVETDKGWKLA